MSNYSIGKKKVGSLRLRQDSEVDQVAQTIGRAESRSFVRSELTQTAGLGLDSRQEIVGRVGMSMARRSREVIGEMASDCHTPEEQAIAFDFAKVFHARSVQAYDEFAARAYDQ